MLIGLYLVLIVYGFVTEESVIALFLAGIGPGLTLLLFFILFSMGYAATITILMLIVTVVACQVFLRRTAMFRPAAA